ncbi:MAG: YceI family protein [Marinibacterium sp.]|nr:YceI family protein [Marinibacterium sp.]
MKTQLRALVIAVTAALPGLAGAWTLEPDTSTVGFGAIKNDYVGEAFTFTSVSGAVDDAGVASIDIDLASVSTAIDIRDERMVAHVFTDVAKAGLTADIDMAALEALAPGESAIIETEAVLSLLGSETPFDVQMFVMRLGEDRVLASTNAPVYLSTEDLGVDGGVDKLQELAGLDSITRVTPLTARLIFSR